MKPLHRQFVLLLIFGLMGSILQARTPGESTQLKPKDWKASIEIPALDPRKPGELAVLLTLENVSDSQKAIWDAEDQLEWTLSITPEKASEQVVRVPRKKYPKSIFNTVKVRIVQPGEKWTTRIDLRDWIRIPTGKTFAVKAAHWISLDEAVAFTPAAFLANNSLQTDAVVIQKSTSSN
jgi:hypothetical protein